MMHGTEQGALLAVSRAGWGVKSGGDVESPAGFLSLVEVPLHPGERTEMREAVFGDDTLPDNAEAFDRLHGGWYVVQETSDGHAWIIGPTMKPRAESRYETGMADYADWSES